MGGVKEEMVEKHQDTVRREKSVSLGTKLEGIHLVIPHNLVT